MLYRFAQLEEARQAEIDGLVPLHVAVKGHMGTGKDHDIEQFAAAMGLPYFRIPLTGEVRDVTLIGSTHLHGDGKGGTESRWEDGDITRALRGPALLNLSELNAAGAETLFALHGLLDRYSALDLPNGDTVRLRDDVRIFGTMNPTDIRDYAGTQTLNKAFADRWVIWEKKFPGDDQVKAMLELSQTQEGICRGHRPTDGRDQRLLRRTGLGRARRDALVSPDDPRPGPDRSAHLRRPGRPAA